MGSAALRAHPETCCLPGGRAPAKRICLGSSRRDLVMSHVMFDTALLPVPSRCGHWELIVCSEVIWALVLSMSSSP